MSKSRWCRSDQAKGSVRRDGNVLVTRLGAQQRRAETGQETDPPAAPADDDIDCVYEDTTGHNVCGLFAFHWLANGSDQVFGNPITEQIEVDGVRTQYFERARFELRHGADGDAEVMLAPLGAEEVDRILSGAADDRTGRGD